MIIRFIIFDKFFIHIKQMEFKYILKDRVKRTTIDDIKKNVKTNDSLTFFKNNMN